MALSFARSFAPMAALRFSVLPLIDTIMQLAFDKGVERQSTWSERVISIEHACEIECSAINLQRFGLTQYSETSCIATKISRLAFAKLLTDATEIELSLHLFSFRVSD